MMAMLRKRSKLLPLDYVACCSNALQQPVCQSMQLSHVAVPLAAIALLCFRRRQQVCLQPRQNYKPTSISDKLCCCSRAVRGCSGASIIRVTKQCEEDQQRFFLQGQAASMGW